MIKSKDFTEGMDVHILKMHTKVSFMKKFKIKTVLQIRIQDPVLYWHLDPGWEKNPDPGWTSQIIFPRVFRVEIVWCRSESGIILTLDPGWKNSDQGSGINLSQWKICDDRISYLNLFLVLFHLLTLLCLLKIENLSISRQVFKTVKACVVDPDPVGGIILLKPGP